MVEPAVSVDPRRWWSRRWLEPLEEAGAVHVRRVQRGLALARRGAVDELEISPGHVSARVHDERTAPAEVTLRWQVPTAQLWDRASDRLSEEVRFTAALLEGSLPDDLPEVLGELGIRLFPDLEDVARSCTCDGQDPCPHAVAVHSAVASRLERDALLLLEMQGRPRDRLLRAVRDRRGDVDGGAAAVPGSDTGVVPDMFAPRGDLDSVELHPAAVDDPAALISHLGPPPGFDDVGPLVELVERAAATAWRLAAGEGSRAADEELLVAELRAQRVGTAGSLATALGREVSEVRADLDRLFEAGVVLRTGSGDRCRYRAPASSP